MTTAAAAAEEEERTTPWKLNEILLAVCAGTLVTLLVHLSSLGAPEASTIGLKAISAFSLFAAVGVALASATCVERPTMSGFFRILTVFFLVLGLTLFSVATLPPALGGAAIAVSLVPLGALIYVNTPDRKLWPLLLFRGGRPRSEEAVELRTAAVASEPGASTGPDLENGESEEKSELPKESARHGG